jgi:hypothetical protein
MHAIQVARGLTNGKGFTLDKNFNKWQMVSTWQEVWQIAKGFQVDKTNWGFWEAMKAGPIKENKRNGLKRLITSSDPQLIFPTKYTPFNLSQNIFYSFLFFFII